MTDESNPTLDSPASCPTAINGIWHGVIGFGDVSIPIVLRIKASDSSLSGTSDFPRHRRADIALRELSFERGMLRFTTRSFGDYVGHMAIDGLSIAGAFLKEGQRYTLTLVPGEMEAVEAVRPQTPKPPFGYDIQDVYVENTADDCRLAGTLTIPSGRPPYAAALLITGSGAMDRDETVFGHKPFWILADYLSRRGYAVLRLDDRGVGESTGDRSTITMADEARDMNIAFDYLRLCDGLRDVPIGVVGHSMGALTAMCLAAKRGDVAFVVSMAGPGLTLGKTFAIRECEALARVGTGDDAIAKHRVFTQALYEYLRDMDASSLIDATQIAAIVAASGASETAIVQNSEEWIARFNEPWFRSANRMEPVDILRYVKAPVLAINGGLDVQVSAQPNLSMIAEQLERSGHEDFETVELPGLNHLFQTCKTGEFYEYPDIEETFAPLALETIGSWLDARWKLNE